MKDTHQDQIYSTPHESLARFSFDERVAQCFPDMINRSVPGYSQIVSMCGLFAQRYLRDGGHFYDLGCSHGAVTLSVLQQNAKRPFTLTAIDLSPAMIEQAKANLKQHVNVDRQKDIEIIEADILDIQYRPASMIVMNFTLQFLPPEQREALVKRLFNALEPGGVLVISEKITRETMPIEEEVFSLHHDFKRANGYSQLEISQKRSALENVMITDTLATHHERFAEAGFSQHFTWFEYLNFASMLAYKSKDD